MKFDDPSEVEMLCYQMKLADYPRSTNRARINELFNGFPPYSPTEVQENGINVNVNFLEGTGIAHEARTQFYGAFLRPGKYFSCNSDAGPVHKRSARSAVVTKEINRPMKDSLPYFECFRSKFALDILHGIGPSVFRDQDRWCPQPVGVDDVMIPANTLLTMENVPFFAVYRSYTAPELIKLTRGPNVDPAWNLKLVEAALEWIDRETMALMGSNWPEVWSPEKASERVKGDGGFYVGDQVPTLDVWDLYFWNDDKKHAGWKRRMILDSWSTPAAIGGAAQMNRRQGSLYEKTDQFLYNPKGRNFADKMSSIINFQFADLSAVAPFRYHSVRSLGFLLYATCHLQNRLRCKFNEAVFEALLMYFKVKNMDDAQRALKIELANKGFIDDTLVPLPAAERWQVNAGLVEMGLNENRSLIGRHSASYNTSPAEYGSVDKREKTKFEAQAEIQQMTSLVGAALMQAYSYQKFESQEIFRRFCKKNSIDPDVRSFQARCARQDVPLAMLTEEQWEISPERVMGAGNKTLEMVIAEQLMQFRPLYDPSAQRSILRDVTMAITDDPARAEMLVPEQPEVSDSIHDAQLRWGTLMNGGQVNLKDGTNHTEVIETLLGMLGQKVQGIEQQGGMADQKEIMSLGNVHDHIAQEIQVLAQDKNEKQRVAGYQKQLGEISNLIKAFAQRLQQAMKKQAGNGQQPGQDPKDALKVQTAAQLAKIKEQNMKESHAQRTAQREIQFRMEQKRDMERHRMDMQKEAEKSGHELARKQVTTRQELIHSRARTRQELSAQRMKASQESTGEE